MTTRGATEGVTVLEALDASQLLQQTALSYTDLLAPTTSSACKHEIQAGAKVTVRVATRVCGQPACAQSRRSVY